MKRTRSVVLLVALAIVGLTVAPLASGVAASTFAATGTETAQSTSTNASVGTLMQASAAETANGVESGMFEAAYERADNESRAALVSERSDEFESKVASLEAERVALESRRDELSTGAYRSQMARLTVQIASLERSIERTERRVDSERLATLRGNATALRRSASAQAGPEVAAVARGLAGDGHPGKGAGPLADRAGADTDRSPKTGTDTGSPGAGHSEKPGTNGSDTGNGPDDRSTDATSTGSGSPNGGSGAESGTPGATDAAD